MKKILLSLIALSAMACTVQQPVMRADIDPVRPEALPTQGIFYYLPKTAIKVVMTAQKEIVKPGPFYRYSQRYLNLSDVVTENREEWSITGASISTKGLPDPQRMFRIVTQGTPAATSVLLTPQGILRGINLPSGQKSQFSFQANAPFAHQSLEEVSFDDVPFTEEQLLKTSTAAMAEETAKEIYRLRDAKRRLLEGDSQILPPDQGAYQTILKQLEAQEAKFLSMFKGKKIIQQVVQTYYLVPDSGTTGQQVLCRFSSQKGFVDPLDVSGTPVYISIDAKDISAKKISSAPMGKDDQRRGLVYCIPAPAKIKIVDRTTLLTEAEVHLGQFGQLHRLPPTLLDNPNASVVIDPVTGGLIQIKAQPEVPAKTK